jgi:hypothetical protein
MNALRVKPMSVTCEYAKSDMTPCVRKDGNVAWTMDSRDDPVCVGCGLGPQTLNLPPPKDWEKTVENYYEAHDGP